MFECECIPDGPGFCGDGNVDFPPEECDTTNTANCVSGQCISPGQPDQCRCVPDTGDYCGDGSVDWPEECEPADVSGCTSGNCYAPGTDFECQCVEDVVGICGNGITEPPEICDTNDNAACGGRECYAAGTVDECTCVPDVSNVCGNGVIEGPEICEPGDASNCDSGACYSPGTAMQCRCVPTGDDKDNETFFCRVLTTYEGIDFQPIDLNEYITELDPVSVWWLIRGQRHLRCNVNIFDIATVNTPPYTPPTEQVNFTAYAVGTGQSEDICFEFHVLPVPYYLLSPPEFTRLLITKGKLVRNFYEDTRTGSITFWGPYVIVAKVWERK
jgi:hypothetical protein